MYKLALAALALTMTVSACGRMSTAQSTAPAIATSPNPAGATVRVDSVTLADGGWLVIHATEGGKPVVPASIGHARIAPGTSGPITVDLDTPTKPGDVVIAMLHHDTGTKDVYEFGPGSVAEDKPVIVDGKPVVKPIKIE